MRRPLCLAVSLSIVAFSQARAADPPTATSTPASPPTAAAEDPAASAQARAESQAKADAQANADAKAKAIDKNLRAQGYKPIKDNGTVRYCRNEQQLGSRFERPVCGTPEELGIAAEIGKEATATMQRVNGSQRPCLTGGC
jgi:hypothetical protein